jgi:hypothetical protein
MENMITAFKKVIEEFLSENVPQKRFDTCIKCEYFIERTSLCSLSNCNMEISANHLEYKCPLGKFDSIKVPIQ